MWKITRKLKKNVQTRRGVDHLISIETQCFKCSNLTQFLRQFREAVVWYIQGVQTWQNTHGDRKTLQFVTWEVWTSQGTLDSKWDIKVDEYLWGWGSVNYGDCPWRKGGISACCLGGSKLATRQGIRCHQVNVWGRSDVDPTPVNQGEQGVSQIMIWHSIMLQNIFFSIWYNVRADTYLEVTQIFQVPSTFQGRHPIGVSD